MAGVNRVIILGRLGRDPELKYGQASGKEVCRFSLAVSEKYNGEEKTEWFNCVVFGKLANVANDYLHKGEQAFVEGKIQTRNWIDKDGNDRTATEIIVQNLNLISSQKGQNTAREDDQPAPRPKSGTRPEQDNLADEWGGSGHDDMPF